MCQVKRKGQLKVRANSRLQYVTHAMIHVLCLHFLYRSSHMSTNPAYGQQPQQPSEGEDTATGGGEIPFYETIYSHVTANIAAQH